MAQLFNQVPSPLELWDPLDCIPDINCHFSWTSSAGIQSNLAHIIIIPDPTRGSLCVRSVVHTTHSPGDLPQAQLGLRYPMYLSSSARLHTKNTYQKFYINGRSCVLNSWRGQGRSTPQIVWFHREYSTALVPTLYCLLVSLWIKQTEGHLVLFCCGFKKVMPDSLPCLSARVKRRVSSLSVLFLMTITKLIWVSCSLFFSKLGFIQVRQYIILLLLLRWEVMAVRCYRCFKWAPNDYIGKHRHLPSTKSSYSHRDQRPSDHRGLCL